MKNFFEALSYRDTQTQVAIHLKLWNTLHVSVLVPLQWALS